MKLVMCLIIIKILNETHGKSIFETTSMIQSNSEEFDLILSDSEEFDLIQSDSEEFYLIQSNSKEFIMTNSTEEYSKKVLNNLLFA